MIEVRIRHQSEASAIRLCDWPATELDQLIPTLRRWSINGEEYSVSGQFLTDGEAAYFELVYGED